MVAGENRTHDPKPMFYSRRLLVKVLVCRATGKRFNQSPTPTQNILYHKQNNTHGLRARGGVGCDPKQSGASPLAALLLSNTHDVRKSVQVELLRVCHGRDDVGTGGGRGRDKQTSQVGRESDRRLYLIYE